MAQAVGALVGAAVLQVFPPRTQVVVEVVPRSRLYKPSSGRNPLSPYRGRVETVFDLGSASLLPWTGHPTNSRRNPIRERLRAFAGRNQFEMKDVDFKSY